MPLDLDVVVTTEDTLYLNWQTWLLALSMIKSGQPGRLVSAVSQVEEDRLHHPFPGYLVTSKGFRALGLEDYAPYNRPLALKAYVSQVEGAGTVVVTDPDFLFVRPIDEGPLEGTVLAHRYSFMIPSSKTEIILKRHLRSGRNLIAPVGVPYVMQRSDLARIVDRWYEATVNIRQDPETKEAAGWIAEMWGYCIATAEAGIRHECRPYVVCTTDDLGDRPIVHYWTDAKSPEWSKRSYKPWTIPPIATPQTPSALATVLQAVDAAARLFGGHEWK